MISLRIFVIHLKCEFCSKGCVQNIIRVDFRYLQEYQELTSKLHEMELQEQKILDLLNAREEEEEHFKDIDRNQVTLTSLSLHFGTERFFTFQ